MRDDEGFARYVVGAYSGLVRRGVLLVGDRAKAEDLVQSSLAAAYLRWARVREPDAYVRTVMVRTAIGWRARRWSGEVPTERLPEVAARDALADADLGDAVRAALATLPPAQRAVVVLRYFDDCSEAEIAAALGCSLGTVKSRCARALAALRASGVLEGEGHPA
ncbi:MAG TPA: SigE family RNA polymerase sigma factor [Acidimicrobiales bacterium]|nr:SigE family RNA polymerase sigma factor [Acidimicrobiales bacterium]